MSVFHEGELAVQTKLGVKEAVDKIGSRAIRTFMPEQHRQFYEAQSMIIAGVLDQNGQPWATPVLGAPGLIQSPDEHTLIIHQRPVLEHAGVLQLQTGQKMGLLGIELSTRRRNRVNGTIVDVQPQHVRVSVDQSFGNCPKYIQKRQVDHHFDEAEVMPVEPHNINDQVVREHIEQADTFFIASASAAMDTTPASGVDVSHRGGRPGFVRVSHEGNILFPDYAGNRFYNTLGNIQVNPNVGLFVPDFHQGSALWITGKARILWEPERVAEFKGAERFIEIEPAQIVLSQQIGLKQTDQQIEYSPVLSGTGQWREPHQASDNKGQHDEEAP